MPLYTNHWTIYIFRSHSLTFDSDLENSTDSEFNDRDAE